jgi:hypothetical protein
VCAFVSDEQKNFYFESTLAAGKFTGWM